MRYILLLFLLLPRFKSFSQKVDSIDIPKGVVYNYCSPAILEKAMVLVANEVSGTPTYSLDNGVLIVGPVLWSRYSHIPSLASISGGNVTINFNNDKLSGKMTQTKEGFKLIWDQVRSDLLGHDFVLRKATFKELQYYWAIISFDIDEPLLVIETNQHRFILNLSPKDLTLLWLDEAPTNTK